MGELRDGAVSLRPFVVTRYQRLIGILSRHVIGNHADVEGASQADTSRWDLKWAHGDAGGLDGQEVGLN